MYIVSGMIIKKILINISLYIRNICTYVITMILKYLVSTVVGCDLSYEVVNNYI